MTKKDLLGMLAFTLVGLFWLYLVVNNIYFN